MWIKSVNEATSRLYDDEVMTEPVSFSSNGTAQVSEGVGTALVAKYEAIIEYSASETEE